MIVIVGLGPGSLDRVSPTVMSILLDPARTVVARTVHHPAASELAALREVVFCDDIYERSDAFGDVYEAIADRVLGVDGPVVYAVPGSPLIGEFAVGKIRERAESVELIPGESFLDAVLAEVGYDPLDRGLQILNGHELPDPLILDKPTVITHLDRAEIMADVLAAVAKVVPAETNVITLAAIGAPDARVITASIDQADPSLAGFRTSLFIDAEPGGLIGAIRVMRRLRAECPWDQEQTHQSLVKNLIEETYELIEVIGGLSTEDTDWVAYSRVEDELGDVLLQVLFHEAIAREVGAFDIDGAASVLTAKLIRRHPHVFGDVEVDGADEVKANWDRIKSEERGEEASSSMDGVPTSMPALSRAAKLQNRAAKIGFDWETATQVLGKLGEEFGEIERAMSGDGDIEAETGDLLFTVVNLARHLQVDPELALRGAVGRFESRFRAMEADGPLEGLDITGLDERWEQAKSREQA